MAKDSIIVGILFGLLTPVFGYYLIEALFDLYAVAMNEPPTEWRVKTLSVMALCMNLIPFHLFRIKYYDKALRGVVFPTIFYVVIWVFYFWDSIFLT